MVFIHSQRSAAFTEQANYPFLNFGVITLPAQCLLQAPAPNAQPLVSGSSSCLKPEKRGVVPEPRNMGTGAWKSSPLLPHRAQTVPSPVPMQRLRSDNFHRLSSAHTCYFPLSNLTFWYLTVSRVWHLKHLEEKQPAEAPREIRRKALIVSAGQ